MRKFLRINMSNLSFKLETPPNRYEHLGGRVLISQLMLDEVDPRCEPMGLFNKLIIAPGILGGTSAPSSGRLSIGSKSPLTGGIKESNVGGPVANKLSRLGYQAVIVEGKPEKGWYILNIDKKGVNFLKADHLINLDNYDACMRLRQEFGEKAGIILIGIAGERGYPMATCAVADLNGYPTRHAARGGIGAVMGSRGIKAIVIDDNGTSNVDMYDSVTYRNLSKIWAKQLIDTKKVLVEQGTANLVLPMNEVGCLPTRNFSSGRFENASKISGHALAGIIKARGGVNGHACHAGCPIRCSNIYVDAKGKYLTSSLEYETIVLMGSNLDIDDLDFIAYLDRFCDGFGVDTIELGNAIGIAMEAGVISFGDIKGVEWIIKQIKEGTVIGRVLTQGAVITGKVLGVKRVAAIKGQGMAAYDPRALKGTGVTYATSPMGADHTAGNCLPGRGGYRPETSENNDVYESKGHQVQVSKDLQILAAICDSTGLCYMVGGILYTAEMVGKLLTAFYGRSFSIEDVIEIGKKSIANEIKFNYEAGITSAHNRMPEFLTIEKLPPTGERFDIDSKELESLYKSFY